MKKFRFRLETLLGARRTQERARMEELGRQGRQLAAETERLEALAAARDAAVAGAPGEPDAQDVDLNRARLDETWRRHLADQVQRQGERVKEAAARTDEAREALLAAARDRSVVERLREKRAEEHREAVAQEEQKQLDEVAGRLLRNQSGNAVLIVIGLVVVYILLFTAILKLTGILDKQIIPRLTGKPVAGAVADSLKAKGFPTGNLDRAARADLMRKLTAERDSLSALSARLSVKTQEMTARLQVLETMKSEIDAANAEADSLARVQAPVDAGYADLAKVYSSMKPQELGPILAKLNEDTLFGVAHELKGRQLAKFLSALSPDKAAALSERMAAGEGESP